MASYHHLKPALRIGKQGLTPGVIKEIKHLLKTFGTIKIKMLPSFMEEGKDRKAQAREIAQQAGALLRSAVGGTVVLERLETPEFDKKRGRRPLP